MIERKPTVTRAGIERLCRDAGHAINANNGRCEVVEDVLCTVTTVCVELLALMDAGRLPEDGVHREKGA